MKRALLVSVLILTAIIFCACAQGTPFTAGDMTFEVHEFAVVSEFDSIAPAEEGSALLAVRLSAAADADPSAVTELFYGDEKCTASDGTGNYECKAIAFSDENGDTSSWLIFEIPSDSEGVEFTVSGSTFESFSGTAK